MEIDRLINIDKIDKQNMYEHICRLPDQFAKGWHDTQEMILPSYYLTCNKVVILGMGGSGISGDIVYDLAAKDSKISITPHHDYGLPYPVDRKTMVIAVSYSGNTEETLDGFIEAHEAGAKLIAITSGGEMERLCGKYRIPVYKIIYSSPPRVAFGYLFGSVLGICKRLEIVDVTKNDVREAIILAKKHLQNLLTNVGSHKNQAKEYAKAIQNYIPFIWAGSTLRATAIRWKGQFNENSKSVAYAESLPELNHNSITGFNFPKNIQENLYVLMLQSKYDHPRIRARQEISDQILNKSGIVHKKIFIEPSGHLLSEILIMIQLGDFTSYYLALLYDIDPTETTNIEFLKKKLSERG